jgi:O-antigen/teichoic acid export membrane protein
LKRPALLEPPGPAAWWSALAPRLGLNTGSKLAAEVVGRALQFLMFYLAQRALGPAAYGEFTYALAAGYLLATLTDLGLQLTLTRELARDEARAAEVAGAGLALKSLLALAAGALLLLFSLSRPAAEQGTTLILGLAMIGSSFVETLGYIFRGLQRVDHEAGLTLLMRLTTVGLGLWAVQSGRGPLGLAWAFLGGSCATAALGLGWLRARFFAPRLGFAPARWWPLLREALPLGGAIVLSVGYTRTAVFLLQALQGSNAVGLYGVAQKLTEPLAILPAAVMAAVFPAYTQSLAQGGGRAGWLGRRAALLLAAAGAGIAAAGVWGGPWLIQWLYGEQYRGAEPALQILSAAVLFSFVNYALTHFLIAWGRQRLNLLFNGLLFGLNAALCLYLVPRFGLRGAAAAVLASEVLLSGLCTWALARRAPAG